MYEWCDECGREMKNPYAEIDMGVYLCKRCYQKKYGDEEEYIDDNDLWGDDGRYNEDMED